MAQAEFHRAIDGSLDVMVHEERRVRGRRNNTSRTFDAENWYVAPIPPMPFTDEEWQAVRKLRPNRYRITTALDYRMLGGPEVDEALGVEEPTVDEWEAGAQIPGPEDIGRLARLTGFPVLFFYGETLMTPSSGLICGGGQGCQPIYMPSEQGATRPVRAFNRVDN